jgi:hypothetical protein
MVLGIAAFALAGVLVGRTMRADVAHAETGHHAAATEVAANDSSSAPVVAPGTVSQAPAAEPDAKIAPVAKAAPLAKTGRTAAKSAATVAAPKPVAAEPVVEAVAPAVATAIPAAAKPASCRLPYIVDAEGHRHYKVECL